MEVKAQFISRLIFNSCIHFMCILPVVYAGHFDHMKSWFSSKGGRSECPTGCGCLCEEVCRVDADVDVGPGIGRQGRGEPSDEEDSSDGEDSDAGHEGSDAGHEYDDLDLYRKYFSQYK